MSVLVVAAHPDDEVLGCGAVASMRALTENVYAFLFGCGRNGTMIQKAEAAAKIIGYADIMYSSYDDQRYDSECLLDLTQTLEWILKVYEPHTVYTHSRADLNKDHRLVHEAVLTACRPQPGAMVKTIYCFETLSSTEWQYPANFNPNVWVEVGSAIQTKTKAMQMYDSEIRDRPHPRSINGILALAAYRGQQIGCEYAEAFELVREIR